MNEQGKEEKTTEIISGEISPKIFKLGSAKRCLLLFCLYLSIAVISMTLVCIKIANAT